MWVMDPLVLNPDKKHRLSTGVMLFLGYGLLRDAVWGRFLEAGGRISFEVFEKIWVTTIYNQIQKEAQLDKRIEIRTPLIITIYLPSKTNGAHLNFAPRTNIFAEIK